MTSGIFMGLCHVGLCSLPPIRTPLIRCPTDRVNQAVECQGINDNSHGLLRLSCVSAARLWLNEIFVVLGVGGVALGLGLRVVPGTDPLSRCSFSVWGSVDPTERMRN